MRGTPARVPLTHHSQADSVSPDSMGERTAYRRGGEDVGASSTTFSGPSKAYPTAWASVPCRDGDRPARTHVRPERRDGEI